MSCPASRSHSVSVDLSANAAWSEAMAIRMVAASLLGRALGEGAGYCQRGSGLPGLTFCLPQDARVEPW
jgi:hypothetical protein